MTTLTSSKMSTPMKNTISYYVAFIALGIGNASLGPTLPGLAENTGSTISQISALFLWQSLGYLSGSIIGGWLYDRVAGHRLLAITLFGVVIFLALSPMTSWLLLLIIVMFLLGLMKGILDVGGNTLIVWLHGDKVGPYMNALHFFFGVGAFLSPVIVAQALSFNGGILWAYWIMALVILPVAIWFLQLPSPSIQTKEIDQADVTVNYWIVALIVLFFFMYAGAEVGFSGWIFTYAIDRNFTEVNASYLNSAFWATFTIGRLLSIPIATRLRPRVILSLDLLGAIFSITLLILWSNSTVILWVSTLLYGLSIASVFPTILSLAERRMTISGQITGWFFAGASAGVMFWPWFIGQRFEQYGSSTMMTTLMVNLSAAFGLFIVLILSSKKSVQID